MYPPDCPTVLVARFLRANSYNETLAAFLAETGLPPDAGSTSAEDLTIEKVLNDKKLYELGRDLEKVGVQEKDQPRSTWDTPVNFVPTSIGTLPTSSNLLHVSIETITNLVSADVSTSASAEYILATASDRRLSILSTAPPYPLIQSMTHLHDSAILSCAVVKDRWLVSTSMSGQLTLSDLTTGDVITTRRDHSKFAVRVAVTASPSSETIYVATCGWDLKVHLYDLTLPPPGHPIPSLSSPTATLTLPTNPSHILFTTSPQTDLPYLVVARTDSTILTLHHLPSLSLASTQNLHPSSLHTNAFTPSFFLPSPTDTTLLAIATDTDPSMRLLFARILFPPPSATSAHRFDVQSEESALLGSVNTSAPQTKYSTPQLAWRPGSEGVWVNSDDGVVRGVAVGGGRAVQSLGREGAGGHGGKKVRCLAGGVLEGGKEVLLSGGFDRRLVVWEVVGTGS